MSTTNKPPSTPPNSKVVRHVLYNSAAGYISKAINLATAFALIPFMVRHLGNDQYGLWILVGSIVAYGSLLDCGIASAVTKYVAEYHSLRQLAKAKTLVCTAIWFYCALGILLALFFFLMAPLVATFFTIEPDQYNTAKSLVFITGLGIGLSIPLACTTAVLNGLQRFDLTSLLGTLRALLFALGTVTVLLTGGDILAVALVQLLALLLVQLPALHWIEQQAPQLQFGRGRASRRDLAKLLSFSWSILVVHLGGQLKSKTDEIIIGTRLPMAAITPYALALKLSEIPQLLSDQFLKMILPMAAELHAAGDQDRLTTLFFISTRLTLAIFLSIGGCLVVMAAPLLTLWVGSSYAVHANLVFIMVAALLFDTLQWPAAFILQALNRHRILAITAIITGIANISLSLALLPKWGLTGVALGTLIPSAVELLLVILPFFLKTMAIKPYQFFTQVVIPSTLPAIPMLLFFQLGGGFSQPETLWQIIINSTTAMIIYIAVYLLIPANHYERNTIFGLLPSVFATIKKAVYSFEVILTSVFQRK